MGSRISGRGQNSMTAKVRVAPGDAARADCLAESSWSVAEVEEAVVPHGHLMINGEVGFQSLRAQRQSSRRRRSTWLGNSADLLDEG
jgi:hypothetical protein